MISFYFYQGPPRYVIGTRIKSKELNKVVRVIGHFENGDYLVDREDGQGWDNHKLAQKTIDDLTDGNFLVDVRNNWRLPNNDLVEEEIRTEYDGFSIGQIVSFKDSAGSGDGIIIGFLKDHINPIVVESDDIINNSLVKDNEFIPGFISHNKDKIRIFNSKELSPTGHKVTTPKTNSMMYPLGTKFYSHLLKDTIYYVIGYSSATDYYLLRFLNDNYLGWDKNSSFAKARTLDIGQVADEGNYWVKGSSLKTSLMVNKSDTIFASADCAMGDSTVTITVFKKNNDEGGVSYETLINEPEFGKPIKLIRKKTDKYLRLAGMDFAEGGLNRVPNYNNRIRTYKP